MIDSLESMDRDLVLYINGCHNSFFDEVMWFFSGPFIIIPIFIIILWSLFKKYSLRDVGFILLGFVLVIAIVRVAAAVTAVVVLGIGVAVALVDMRVQVLLQLLW